MQHKPELAYQYLSKSLTLSKDVEDGLNMVILLGNAGYLQHALKLLHQTETVYKNQPENTLKKSKENYDKTIKETKYLMIKDLQSIISKESATNEN